MAKVRQRTWTIPGQRTKRKAWGYVTINERGKQVRCFKAEWTKEAARKKPPPIRKSPPKRPTYQGT